jgi:hypothetical protein
MDMYTPTHGGRVGGNPHDGTRCGDPRRGGLAGDSRSRDAARRRRQGGRHAVAGELPKNSFGVLDHLYARAVVIESGTSSAALITVDAGGIPTPVWEAVTRQLESELKIPVANVLLTATHTHSAGGPRGPDYAQKIVESVRQARQRLAPARVGYGTGVSFINVNRQIIDPKTGRWWEGPNYDGPRTRPWPCSSSRRSPASRSPSTTTTRCTP